MKVKCFATLLFTAIGFITANEQPETLNSFINSVRSSNGSVWAVLVATGNQYWDYRFQSAILHVHHLLVAKGVPKNQIITMLNENNINAKYNQNRGKVYSAFNDKEIYSGVTIDYTGREVSATNFKNILLSNSTNGKKVLGSTVNDGVIVYYAGYGAHRMLVFPENSIMLGTELVNIVKFMKQGKTYKKMMFVVDSSKSGSVFLNFSKFTDVHVQTATDAVTDIDVAYYNSSMGIYMISVFSLKWLMLSDNDHSYLTTDDINLIWGMLNYLPFIKQENALMSSATQFYAANRSSDKLTILDLIKRNEQRRNRVLEKIIFNVDSDPIFLRNVTRRHMRLTDTNCYRSVVETFQQKCQRRVFAYSHATLIHMYKFSNLCRLNGQINVIERAIAEECSKAL